MQVIKTNTDKKNQNIGNKVFTSWSNSAEWFVHSLAD